MLRALALDERHIVHSACRRVRVLLPEAACRHRANLSTPSTTGTRAGREYVLHLLRLPLSRYPAANILERWCSKLNRSGGSGVIS
jgi:hypothetical protein